MLDRVMKSKPKALGLVYEGNLLFVRNKSDCMNGQVD